MITSDLGDFLSSYPSVYLQCDIHMAVEDNPDAQEVVEGLLRQFSVGFRKEGEILYVWAQKVILDSDALVAFLAVLHDNDVSITPPIKLVHNGIRRFDVYPAIA